MGKNSFKELEKLYIAERRKDSEETRNKLESNIRLFSFISNLVDVYLPKAGKVITSFGNTNKDHKKDQKPKKYPNQ
jgi:hypothetical protein